MRQVLRYHAAIIPSKMKVDIRIIVDDRGTEYVSTTNGVTNTSLTLYPVVGLTITRPATVDENGVRKRAPFDPYDSIALTKYNFPLFLSELKGIQNDMKTPSLYSYQGSRLELNEEEAQKIRRVIVLGKTVVELSAAVLIQADESRVEGIKMKFNNEQHHIMLTLNDITALSYILEHLDVDAVTVAMYQMYVNRADHPKTFDQGSLPIGPNVDIDITPKVDEFKLAAEE